MNTTERMPGPLRLQIDVSVLGTHCDLKVFNGYQVILGKQAASLEESRQARMIVSACNAHDDLVSALREIARDCDDHHFSGKVARAALAKAGAA